MLLSGHTVTLNWISMPTDIRVRGVGGAEGVTFKHTSTLVLQELGVKNSSDWKKGKRPPSEGQTG